MSLKSLCFRTCSRGYIIEKENISNVIFLVIRGGRIFYRWRGSWVKIRVELVQQHRGNQDVTWSGTTGGLVLFVACS